jgi:stage II sporulation protein P
MNRRKLRGFCAGLLLFAGAIRLLPPAAGQALRWPEPVAALWENWNGEVPRTPRVWLLRVLPAAQDKPDAAPEAAEPDAAAASSQSAPEEQAAPPLAFDAAEADAITIAGACTYETDKRALLTQPSALDFSAAGPKVLIVHTHSSEAYTQETGWEYTPSDTLRTSDPARSVIRVGDEIASVLESRGIETLHDTALNDYPSYNGAYARMQTTIEGYLARYPSIQMVIDVHRDATADAAGNPTGSVVTVNGEKCAQVMLVMGTDEGGLEHPDWRENLANALKLQALLNRSYPGLCKAIDLRTERFNEHETPGSMLAEFGSTGNTLQEAIRAGHDFAEGLAALILGLENG